MYCRKCGREIPDDSVMCGYCGTPTNPDNPYTYGGTPQNMDEGATVSHTHLTLPTTAYV